MGVFWYFVGVFLRNKIPALVLEEQGNSILYQGNQEETFPLGDADGMLIPVCFPSSGSGPGLWLWASS